MHEGCVGPRQEFRLRPAQHARPGRTDRGHHPLVIGSRQHVLGQGPETIPLGCSLGDLLLQGRVEDLERLLHVLALRDVGEEDRDPARSRITHAHGTHIEPALEGLRPVLEMRSLTRQRDATVSVEPVSLQVRVELTGPSSCEPGSRLALEGGVGLDDPVVDCPICLVELHLDEKEPDIDALEERAVTFLALCQRCPRADLLRDVNGGAERPHAAPGLVEHAPALGGNPAYDAILLADRAVLHVVGGAPHGIEGRGEGRGGCVVIVRMQAGVEFGNADGQARRDAEHRPGAVRPGQHVGEQIEVPGADLGGFCCKP
ncbi:hypothetical protein OCOJLMKI_5297 [Methylobacterium iners]|uniref:Uncharacterized protein n=1 Tax=Methylobacterium iners TaxID=418707 RepID=A0ABQ4S8D7_9HYPH|nr:hypothetical protein OCOJLMKI_5297 [Methylobacterium iners]